MAHATAYNNPEFASGIGDVLQTMFSSPDASAAALNQAAQAGSINDTRNYRLGLGQAGDAGDYGAMMIRALQAGNQYSNNAPEITAALASLPGSGFSVQDMANIQVGAGVQRASGTFARGGGGGGGGAPSRSNPNARFSASNRNLLLSGLEDQGVGSALSLSIANQTEQMMREQGLSELAAIDYAMSNLARDEGTPGFNPWYPFGIKTVDAVPPAITGLNPYQTGQIGQPAAAQQGGPSIGAIESGYRFLGGDPADRASWEKV